MSKHTKGPWKAKEYGSPLGRWYVKDAKGEMVTTRVDDKANARLIAAAPLMFKLYELTFRYWMTSDTSEDEEIYTAIAEVEEHFRATAKVEGEDARSQA